MAMSEAKNGSCRRERKRQRRSKPTRSGSIWPSSLAGIEAERISKEENAAKRSVLAAQAQKDLFTEIAQAQDQLEESRRSSSRDASRRSSRSSTACRSRQKS